MASINKINVNNTTYEIVPGNTIYPLCVECGYIEDASVRSIVFLPSEKVDNDNFIYYGCDKSGPVPVPVDFVLKQNLTTKEITMVALVQNFLDFDSSGNPTDPVLMRFGQSGILNE